MATPISRRAALARRWHSVAPDRRPADTRSGLGDSRGITWRRYSCSGVTAWPRRAAALHEEAQGERTGRGQVLSGVPGLHTTPGRPALARPGGPRADLASPLSPQGAHNPQRRPPRVRPPLPSVIPTSHVTAIEIAVTSRLPRRPTRPGLPLGLAEWQTWASDNGYADMPGAPEGITRQGRRPRTHRLGTVVSPSVRRQGGGPACRRARVERDSDLTPHVRRHTCRHNADPAPYRYRAGG